MVTQLRARTKSIRKQNPQMRRLFNSYMKGFSKDTCKNTLVEYKSYWANCESLVIEEEGLLCRELVGSGKSRRLQVVLLSLLHVILEMLHDSVTTEHM